MASSERKRKRIQEEPEEIIFPRGGASILTPLEYKQIQIDATRDVLFEQRHKSTTTAMDNAEPRTRIDPKRTKTRQKSNGRWTTAEAGESYVKIEGLNYKRLVAGSLVLGQICEINGLDIALSLPNNLTGYVPITSISQRLTEVLEASAAKKTSDIIEEKDYDSAEVDLQAIFKIGNYVRAYVVSTSDILIVAAGGKAKKRIELSLRPEQTNNNLSVRDLIPSCTLMAAVTSVEDHGIVMSLGLKEDSAKGFLPTKELNLGTKLSNIREGAVMLCMVTELTPNGKTVKLTADARKIGDIKQSHYLSDAPTMNCFLPGTAIEIMIEDIKPWGISGKLLGMIDITADLIHSGAGAAGTQVEKKYKVGSKSKSRIICTFPNIDTPKLGASFLDHVLEFTTFGAAKDVEWPDPLTLLPLSTIIEEVKVRRVEPDIGLFVSLGVQGLRGFVHISRIRDGAIDTLLESAGPYRTNSAHRGRLIGYNYLDGLFIVSLEQSILAQPFLRVEDIPVGDLVQGRVDKLVFNDAGLGGVIVSLAEGISALVPRIHMSDVSMHQAEKKFKEGAQVNARVLSVDPHKRRVRLTLKKSLVHSEATKFLQYEGIQVGMQSPGTIISITSKGAVVQFFGNVRGFLPVGEMSEAYISDPQHHFHIGQVVNVHVLGIDASLKKMTVSCKDLSALGSAQRLAWTKLRIGEIVSASVLEKTDNSIRVALHGNMLPAFLPITQLSDGPAAKNVSALKKIRIGAHLTSLAVLSKSEKQHSVILTSKKSLVRDAKNRVLLRDFEDVKENKVVQGFVKNITPGGVFVEFGNGLTGFLSINKLPHNVGDLPDFGFKRFQSIKTRVISIDHLQRRFFLSMRDFGDDKNIADDTYSPSQVRMIALNPVDENIATLDSLKIGTLTKARVASVKDTQINVQLADNIQGRIDISQVFDNWLAIKDRKRPLKSFSAKDIIPVRVIGVHDARSHRFLPITHRRTNSHVFELSAKPSDQTLLPLEPLTLKNVETGSSWIAFVNNISEEYLWVNLSPNVRGRIRALDVSDDILLLEDLAFNFPIGSALRVHVVGTDIANNRLDLSARSLQSAKPLAFEELSKGMIVVGRVTRVDEKQLMVQLENNLPGSVHLTDLADDFLEADLTTYAKNDIIRVCIIDIDESTKRIRLSTRPSKVLSSSLAVADPEIATVSDVQVCDVVRGFIKNISDKGLFINLGGNITAYARVSDLSDTFIKDWQSQYKVNQLVRARIIGKDPSRNQVQVSLKPSVVEKDYQPLLTFEDMKIGQVVHGKIRKVEEYGVFIIINGSQNVSGLCHKTELAEKRVRNAKELYAEGDAVKAKILKLDPPNRRISFSLKVSHFNKEANLTESSEDEGGTEILAAPLAGINSDFATPGTGDIDSDDVLRVESVAEASIDPPGETMSGIDGPDNTLSLHAGGFHWGAAASFDNSSDSDISSPSVEHVTTKKKHRRNKIETLVDRTEILDIQGPQSASDFERHLLGQSDSSRLWIQYMAFQMQLGELHKARQIAERAIAIINVREETEKLNVWIALLNLEVTYGSEETLESIFQRACQYNDAREIHERLISIYIQSGKHSKADLLFQVLIKKFSQLPSVWYNYAHFLHTTMADPERARALLPRATQSLPSNSHLSVTLRFAALEFRSASGSPERGRTIFEGLLSTFPKRLDIWSQLLDLEIQQGEREVIRDIFERALNTRSLKAKGAKSWFRKWSEWEEHNGDKKSREKVKAKAEEWVQAAAIRKSRGEED